MANWHLLGEVTVSNDWQLFPSTVNQETFRITATILNQDDWDKWKFKSGAYLQFFYPTAIGSYSQPIYIKVQTQPIIYQFPIPKPFIDDGFIVRDLQVKRASRYLPVTPNDMFAAWSIRIEEYF